MEILNLSGIPFSTALTSQYDEKEHMHDFYECFFIKEGKIYHEIDNKDILLKTGDACIISPYFSHRFKRISGETCIHRDTLISKERLVDCINLIDKDLLDLIDKNHYIHFKMSNMDIENYESNIMSYISIEDVPKKLKLEKCLVVELLCNIIKNNENDLSSNNFISKCTMALNNSFTHFNAVEEVYNNLGYNRSYLSKKFKDSFGVTLTDKINDLKIEYSAYLLSITDYTIPEICEKIGIESIPYFHKLFKKRYGFTPYKARKQL